jgi:hypothetical protein
MEQPGGNPSLPGLRTGEIIVLSEKTQTIGNLVFPHCWKKCLTHFGEDSVPYHPGEKSCLDRCAAKSMAAFDIAKARRKIFEEKIANEKTPYKWMKTLSGE